VAEFIKKEERKPSFRALSSFINLFLPVFSYRPVCVQSGAAFSDGKK